MKSVTLSDLINSTIENEVKVSQEKEKITLNDLKHWPEQDDLLEGIDEITDCYNETKHEMKLWHQRHKQLLQLYSDMKSIHSSNTALMRSMSSSIYVKQSSQENASERSATSSPIPFSPDNSTSPCPSPFTFSLSRSPSRPKLLSSQSFTENLALQLRLYPDLKTAFLPLVGRESTLLPPGSTVAECVRQVPLPFTSHSRFLTASLWLVGPFYSSERQYQEEGSI